MKKILFFPFLTLLPLIASAYNAKINGIYYNFSESEAEVTFQKRGELQVPTSDYSGAVVIPESVVYNGKSYNVTSIGVQAFRGCDHLTSISIPECVTRIGNNAFRDCHGLSSISIPKCVSLIEDYTFINCTGLTSVSLPDSLKAIAVQAFDLCSKLTSVSIPDAVTTIGYKAFGSCSSLKSIHFGTETSINIISSGVFDDTPWFNDQPDGLVYAGKVAYKYKGEMPEGTSIVLKEGTLGIAREAFRDCSGLTSINIPESVKEIGSLAFMRCSGLYSIIIPEGITNIAETTFSGCTNLVSVKIPESMINIGYQSFTDCSNLTEINIPNTVRTISDAAFRGCSSLASFTIPEGCPSVSDCVFYGCTSLTSITIPESAKHIGYCSFTDCSSLVSINIPDSIQYIDDYAFQSCSSLTTITIPEKVTYIGYDAFRDCIGLTSVVCKSQAPTYCMPGAFDGVDIQNCVLHVPAGSIEKYKTTSPWSGFGNIVALPDNNDYFYYYNGSKIPLTLNENKVVVSIPKECNETSERIQANVQVLTTIKDNYFDIFVISWSDYEHLSSMDSWEEDEKNVVLSSCYFTERNDELCASPYLNVKIKKEQDTDLLNAYVEEYKLRFDDYKPLLEFWYVLSVTPETEKDPLQMANELYESGDFAASVPDLVPLGSLIGPEPLEPITFTEGQMATIILPTEPDASKGKYYRLDRVEDRQIIFEQELQPRAHVPYIIVPSEDFSIDLNNMDLEGCSPDTVSIEVRFEGQAESQSIYFIGSYVSEELEQQEGCNIQLIDTTPDCSISFSEGTGKETFLIGALRAYLTWDDPYNQGGTKGRGDKLEIVLRDYGTSIEEMKNEELRSFSSTKSMKNDVFDLSGRKIVNGQLQRGIYIENGVKKVTKQ